MLQTLPCELLFEIYSFLPPTDLRSLSFTSRHFLDLRGDVFLWSTRAWQDFGFPRNLFSTSRCALLRYYEIRSDLTYRALVFFTKRAPMVLLSWCSIYVDGFRFSTGTQLF